MTRFLATAFFLLLLVPVAGQEIPPGLILGDEGYGTVSVDPLPKEKAPDDLPRFYSLKNYCPTPGDQGKSASCVSWATAYSALTIMRAFREKKVGAGTVKKTACSPHYVYNQVIIGKDCDYGSGLKANLEILKNQGACLLSTFNPGNCKTLPALREKEEAKNYKIKDYKIVFDSSASYTQKLNAIKVKLKRGIPVIVGLASTKSFRDIERNRVTRWNPSKTERHDPERGHTMVIVGYNDGKQAFELMNSYGEKWGNGGFIWLGYEGFNLVVKKNFYLDLGNGEKYPGSIPEEDLAVCQELQRIVYLKDSVSQKPEPIIFNAAGVFYEQNSEAIWRSGDDFVLHIEGIAPGRYLYVFGQDARGETNLYFPEGGQTGRITSENVRVRIPEQTEAVLRLGPPGREYLCSLICNFPMQDIEARLDALQQTPGEFFSRLQTIFPELVPRHQIDYSEEDMCVVSILKNERPSIVPLIFVFDIKE